MINQEYFNKLHDKRKQLSLQLSAPAASGFWRMVVDKYSEKAHFVFELLQNADDAKATSVRFVMENDGLYFIHNGSVQFSITNPDEEGCSDKIGHLNSITSIGASTKKKSSSIGKFGIGFKSVFQYTSRPHIEDDNYSFCLEDYIVPVQEDRLPNMRNSGETLFYFPFDDADVAIAEISKSLKEAKHPLLFLRTLKELRFNSNVDNTNCYWSLDVQSSNSFFLEKHCILHEIIISASPDNKTEYFHKLSLPISNSDFTSLTCAVVLGADSDGRLFPVHLKNNCFCFFTLEEKLNVPFILHAPFLLTENRELIKRDEQWNEDMFSLLSQISSSLFVLIMQNKLKIGCNTWFELLPDCLTNNGEVEYRFVDQFVRSIKKNGLLLADDGTTVPIDKLLYSPDKELKFLFSNKDLGIINENWQDKKWAFAFLDFVSSGNKNIYVDFLLKNKLLGDVLSLENIITFLNEAFLEDKSKEWLLVFYSLLLKSKKVLQSKDFWNSKIFKCVDGRFRSIYNEKGIVQLYKSTDSFSNNCSSLFFVDDIFHEDKLSVLCENVGIGEPSELVFIEKNILERYKYKSVKRSDIELLSNDLVHISRFFSSLGYDTDAKNTVITLVKDVAFLPSVDSNGATFFSEAGSLYFDSADIRTYFAQKDGICFFDNDIIRMADVASREKIYYFLQYIGVQFTPRILENCFVPNKDDLSTFKLFPKSLRVHDSGDQCMIDKRIDGFDEMLENWSPKASVSFFRLLGRMIGECGAYSFRKLLSGKYSYVEKGCKKRTEEVVVNTTAYRSIFNLPWLVSFEEKAVSLQNVKDSSDLHEDCLNNDSYYYVLQLLGIENDETLKNLNAEQKTIVRLFHMLNKAGISKEDLQSLVDGNAKIVPL